MISKPLSTVAEVIRGVSFSKDDGDTSPSEGRLPVIRAGSIQDSLLLNEGQIWVPQEKVNDNQKVRRDDIIMCTSSGSSDLVGKCAKSEIDFNGSFGVFCAGIRPNKEKVSASYLYHFLTSPKFRNWSSSSSGANIKNIRISELAEFEIPLPPLEEQKRIAAILDKADAIRRKRQEAIKLADEFLRAVFLDMFGDFVTHEGYSRANKSKISEVLDYIDYRGKTPEKSELGVTLITAKNVRVGYVDDEPREYIPEENYAAWMTRGFPKENDVLFTTEAPMGNIALLGKYEKVALGQRLIALRSKGALTHEYLMYLLLHPFMQTIIYSRSSGSTVRGIRTKELFEIEIPIAPLEHQEKFSRVYKYTKRQIDQITSSSKLCETLFDSLSSQAFSNQ